MLTENQINEIKEHLEKAQNPLFFFDNDNDGLCSFLLLRRYLDRGKGIAIKSFPDLSVSYFKRVKELNPDYIFILDKPIVSQEFLDKIKEANLPVVWIDHHAVEKPDVENYYNSYFHNNGEPGEPVSYLCYKITNKKEDIWLAMIGGISDCFMPDFFNEFDKKYPELSMKNPKSPFDLLYNSEIGRIARILDFSLKDTTTNVVNMLKFMIKVNSPIEVLEENAKTKQILNRYEQINKKYKELMKKARQNLGNKLIYFQYGGDFSLSSNLANQLSYEFPNKFIVVVYINGDIANISMRGKNALKLTSEAIQDIPGATGGGHEGATGAKMSVSDLPLFRDKMEAMIS
ncbi:MAG: DHHA1 domain-containing protein [Candidatus Pacearchaeota archaeon]